MIRREFLAATLGATALATLPDDANAQEKSDGWNEGQVHHLLPTASHNRVLIKASLTASLSRAPKLRMGSTLATTIQTDTQGYFWAFDIHDLDPDTEYECTLTDNGGRKLCDPWPLKTFPHPDQSSQRLRLSTPRHRGRKTVRASEALSYEGWGRSSPLRVELNHHGRRRKCR